MLFSALQIIDAIFLKRSQLFRLNFI